MDNLMEIKIDVLDDKFVVDSRSIANNFEKRHDNILRDIENIKKDVLNFEEMFIESQLPDNYGRLQKVYLMNRDGFSLLAMGFTGKLAFDWKIKYINAFNQMEKAWNTPEQIMARALKMADAEMERLKADNQYLIADNKRMRPKEIFADAVATSHTSILIGDLAKLLKQNGIETGQKRLFEWMRENGYLIKRKGSDWNMPTQKAMELGLFEVKESTVNNPDGSVRINRTTKVTGKGQQYFVNKFLKRVE
ncbi:MAG: phage regulatory protein/antirepressor Ant [Bacillota bacterium]|nr:phage regulatory protein/antirepressor Ant [Bacillota bacterium]